MLVIRLFGGVSIERDGHSLTGPFMQRHRVALLAVLAAAHPRGQSRDRLAAQLWPDRPGESSRNLLNQSVHALRKGLGDDTIVSAGDELRFEPGSVRCDVVEFQAAVEGADHERAVSLYSGSFLEGFVLPGAVEFEHWADQERERLRLACCEALEALAVAAKGAPAEAVTWWRRLAALEPYCARVAIGLMEALEASGDRAAALAHARVHASLLEEEFDAEPNPDVVALAERLRAAPVASGFMQRDAAAPSRAGSPARRTIAVLPFETISPDPDGVQWFVRAVREEISDHLSRVSALTVRPSETVGRVYGDGDRAPEEVASELRVALLLGGTVRVIGNRFHLTVRLIDVAAGTSLWQDTYDGDYVTQPDIFDVQAEVAGRVASALGAAPTDAEIALIEERPTLHPQAWSLYQQGRFQESKATPESLRRAIVLYDQAIAEDPGFGQPYAEKASAYELLAQVERWPPEEYLARVTAAAEQALQIDGTLADAHRMLGVVKLLSWDFSGAEADFGTALRIDPNDPQVHLNYAQFLTPVGRHEEAIAHILRAREIDPIDPFIAANVGAVYHVARRYEEALAEGLKALELDAQHWVAHWYVGLTYAATERYDQAIAALKLAVEFAGGAIEPLPFLAFAYARAGRRSEAEAVLSQLREAAESGYVVPSYFAILYAGLGDHHRAFQWLEKACEDRDLYLVSMLNYPVMDSLRPDPRFQTLMQETGLSDYMAAYEAPARADTGTVKPLATDPAGRLDAAGEAVESVGAVPESTGARTWKRPRLPWAMAAVVVAAGAVYGIASGWMDRDAAAASGAASTGGQRTIAVLPFDNISPDPAGVEWFVDAVRHHISYHLSQVSTLTVSPLESARRVYGDGDRPLREIASDLQVAAVLGGSVLVAGDRFHLIVRLVDVEGDTTLWQHRYEGAYTTEPDILAVFDAQADVTERVASTLGAEPTEAELARIEEVPTRNAKAWSLYWQGRVQESETTPESLHRAVGLYSQAIDEDPGFGEPYAGIASAYLFLAQVERWTREDYVERVSAAAELALQIDSTLADPYRILAEIEFLSWDFSGAEADYETALRLDPDAAMPHITYAQFLNFVGRHEEAIAQSLRAKELAPTDPFITANVGGQYYLARRYEEALAESRDALELDSRNWVAHWMVGATYAATGRYDEAVGALQLAVEFAGGGLDPVPCLAFAYARAGRRSEAEEVLGQLRAAVENEYLAPSYLAIPYAGLGDNDRAFEWLERAYEGRDLFLVWVLAYPELDNLRPDPRFQALMQGTGLSDYMAAH